MKVIKVKLFDDITLTEDTIIQFVSGYKIFPKGNWHVVAFGIMLDLDRHQIHPADDWRLK